MNGQLVAILANIAAAEARIAGMMSENIAAINRGEGIVYSEDRFNSEAFQLDQLAIEARNA